MFPYWKLGNLCRKPNHRTHTTRLRADETRFSTLLLPAVVAWGWRCGACVPRQRGAPQEPGSAEAAGKAAWWCSTLKPPWSGSAHYLHHSNGSASKITHVATYSRRYFDFILLKISSMKLNPLLTRKTEDYC